MEKIECFDVKSTRATIRKGHSRSSKRKREKNPLKYLGKEKPLNSNYRGL